MTALILVDLQNDFMPGGSLEVKNGHHVLPAVNTLMKMPFDKIVATRDWHPPNHGSFAETHHKPTGSIVNLDGIAQVLWPTHCVQGTYGADFYPGWDSHLVNKVFSKGLDPFVDSYSTFFDNEMKRSTGLERYLHENQIESLYIVGLATDYCVKYSAIDACLLKFKTNIVLEGCRGVNLRAQDSEKAFEEMQKAGVKLINLANIFLP